MLPRMNGPSWLGRCLAAGVASVALAACIDQPNPVAPPGSSARVERLSEVGVFQGPLAQLAPAPGFIPYDVVVSLYSDGAEKQRLLWVPPGTQISADADLWSIPAGAYFVKTFYFPRDERDPSKGIQIVETRFLVRTAAGYDASTYVWTDDQSDAFVSGGNVDVPVEWLDSAGLQHDQAFHVPGTSLCDTCHGGRALGLRTRQMGVAGAYADGTADQVAHLVRQGVLDARPPPGPSLVDPFGTAPLDDRARSYLDANCSHCHGAGGNAYSTGVIWEYGSELPTCKTVPAVDGNDRVIVPGEPDRSEFLARMKASDPFVHMPQGESHVPDEAALAVLTEWVKQLSPAGCP